MRFFHRLVNADFREAVYSLLNLPFSYYWFGLVEKKNATRRIGATLLQIRASNTQLQYLLSESQSFTFY